MPSGLRRVQSRLLQEFPCLAVHLIGDRAVEMIVKGDDRKLDGEAMRLKLLFGHGNLLDGEEWTLDPARRYLVNAGSVGQPRDGDPRAAHLVYDSAKRHLAVRRTVYDNVKEAKMTEDASLPEYLAKRLLTGK